jgi:hypothetical protein
MSYQDGWSVPQPPPPSYYPVPQNNGLAVASLITGLLGFMFLIPALAAVGLGIAGLSESRRTGVGRGMSIAGICLGAGWIVLAVLFIVTVVALVPA